MKNIMLLDCTLRDGGRLFDCKFSDYEISEIATYLLFSSQSHFTTAFLKKYGTTPKKYRDENQTTAMNLNHKDT